MFLWLGSKFMYCNQLKDVLQGYFIHGRFSKSCNDDIDVVLLLCYNLCIFFKCNNTSFIACPKLCIWWHSCCCVNIRSIKLDLMVHYPFFRFDPMTFRGLWAQCEKAKGFHSHPRSSLDFENNKYSHSTNICTEGGSPDATAWCQEVSIVPFI